MFLGEFNLIGFCYLRRAYCCDVLSISLAYHGQGKIRDVSVPCKLFHSLIMTKEILLIFMHILLCTQTSTLSLASLSIVHRLVFASSRIAFMSSCNISRRISNHWFRLIFDYPNALRYVRYTRSSHLIIVVGAWHARRYVCGQYDKHVWSTETAKIRGAPNYCSRKISR